MDGEKGSSDTRLYDILELKKDCSADEIRKQYKKLAMKYHPDRNLDDKAAADKFKEISEAYEVLKDDKKREMYDRYGEDSLKNGGDSPFEAQDIFSQFFGGGLFGGGFGGKRRDTGPRKGEDVFHPLKCSLEDLYVGTSKSIKVTRTRICKECDGKGATKDTAVVTCSECGGSGRVSKIQQVSPGFIQQISSVCSKCQGSGKQIDKKFLCKNCQGKKVISDSTTLEVHIDPGMKNEQKITFTGEADERPGVLAGDIVFVLKQKEHQTFIREKNDLKMNKKINLLEALTGVEFTVKHLDGRVLIVRSKPGQVIKPGQTLQVKEEGFPTYKDVFNKGNLYITFDIEFPESIPKKFISQLQQILPSQKQPVDKSKIKATHIEEVLLSEPTYDHHQDQTGRKEAYDEDHDDEDGEGGPESVGCQSA